MVEMMNAMINMDRMYEEGKKQREDFEKQMTKAKKDFEEGKLPFQGQKEDSTNTPLGT